MNAGKDLPGQVRWKWDQFFAAPVELSAKDNSASRGRDDDYVGFQVGVGLGRQISLHKKGIVPPKEGIGLIPCRPVRSGSLHGSELVADDVEYPFDVAKPLPFLYFLKSG